MLYTELFLMQLGFIWLREHFLIGWDPNPHSDQDGLCAAHCARAHTVMDTCITVFRHYSSLIFIVRTKGTNTDENSSVNWELA